MYDDRDTIDAVETSFAVLERLNESGGAGVTELAEEIGVAKSTVHGHLSTLQSLGYVTREGDEFDVALRFLDLGNAARERSALYRVAREKADEIAAETDEKVWVFAEEHGRGIHLYLASGEQSVRTYARTGQPNYLHQLAGGKAILAGLPDDRVDAVVDRHGLPARTDETITDRDDLFAELGRIRERGFAQNDGESIPGLRAVGVPITNADDVAIGALSVSGPEKRLRGERFDEEIPNLLLGSVNEIEINMAYADEP